MAVAAYRVFRGPRGWQVERDGLGRSTHELRQDAISVARRDALADQPSRVVIERADGTADAELSYRRDTPGTTRQARESAAAAVGLPIESLQLLASGHFGQW
jgi:hypothetical protein